MAKVKKLTNNKILARMQGKENPYSPLIKFQIAVTTMDNSMGNSQKKKKVKSSSSTWPSSMTS